LSVDEILAEAGEGACTVRHGMEADGEDIRQAETRIGGARRRSARFSVPDSPGDDVGAVGMDASEETNENNARRSGTFKYVPTPYPLDDAPVSPAKGNGAQEGLVESYIDVRPTSAQSRAFGAQRGGTGALGKGLRSVLAQGNVDVRMLHPSDRAHGSVGCYDDENEDEDEHDHAEAEEDEYDYISRVNRACSQALSACEYDSDPEDEVDDVCGAKVDVAEKSSTKGKDASSAFLPRPLASEDGPQPSTARRPSGSGGGSGGIAWIDPFTGSRLLTRSFLAASNGYTGGRRASGTVSPTTRGSVPSLSLSSFASRSGSADSAESGLSEMPITPTHEHVGLPAAASQSLSQSRLSRFFTRAPSKGNDAGGAGGIALAMAPGKGPGMGIDFDAASHEWASAGMNKTFSADSQCASEGDRLLV
jgi:hypothetical protein